MPTCTYLPYNALIPLTLVLTSWTSSIDCKRANTKAIALHFPYVPYITAQFICVRNWFTWFEICMSKKMCPWRNKKKMSPLHRACVIHPLSPGTRLHVKALMQMTRRLFFAMYPERICTPDESWTDEGAISLLCQLHHIVHIVQVDPKVRCGQIFSEKFSYGLHI